MSKLMIKIHNTETGEVIEREMNAEELAQVKADELALAAKIELAAQAEADKAALLAKLGITADEAKLLLS
jgi:thioesterase domain-containing protein